MRERETGSLYLVRSAVSSSLQSLCPCKVVFCPQSRSLVLPMGPFFHPNKLEEKKEGKQEEEEERKKEGKQEEKKEEEEEKEAPQQKQSPTPQQINLVATIFKLRRELHRAEEQRAQVSAQTRVK